MKVWALFSIENQYYQPDNNLEKLFVQKPTLEVLMKQIIGTTDLNDMREMDIIALVEILKGNEGRINGYDYRIEEVKVAE